MSGERFDVAFGTEPRESGLVSFECRCRIIGDRNRCEFAGIIGVDVSLFHTWRDFWWGVREFRWCIFFYRKDSVIVVFFGFVFFEFVRKVSSSIGVSGGQLIVVW